MSLPRFFSRQPLPQHITANEFVKVSEAVANHMRALRLQLEAQIVLFDGSGFEYRGCVKDIWSRRGEAVVQLLSKETKAAKVLPAFTVTAAIGIHNRIDFAIEKCTELNVGAIQPLMLRRTEGKWNASRVESKTEHWQNIAIRAAEQSGRVTVPAVLKPVTLEQLLPLQPPGIGAVLHPQAKETLPAWANTLARNAQCNDSVAPHHAVLFSGPEGGFTDAELQSLFHHGITAVSFGPLVLRAETAPMAALAALWSVQGLQPSSTTKLE